MLNVRLRFLMELLFYVAMETQTRRQNLYLYLLPVSIRDSSSSCSRSTLNSMDTWGLTFQVRSLSSGNRLAPNSVPLSNSTVCVSVSVRESWE